MLLDKHGGDGHKGGCDPDTRLDPGLAQAAAVPGGKADGHGADHMNAGADVGVGVLAVDQSDQLCEDIVPGKVGDAEILPVGEQ